MSTLPEEAQSGGAGGASTYQALLGLDRAWDELKNGRTPPPPSLVTDEPSAPAETAEYDVVVAGGNIGILLATALVLKGLRVAVVEAGVLRGRNQDWNASRKEVLELVEAGVLSAEEVERVIGIEFNPVRCGFAGGDDVWTTDVLNVGVRPDVLIELARARFEAAGGVVLERAPLASVAVRPGAAVLTTASGAQLRTRLLIDCMGQRSPIVAQAREGALPEGACVVVGTCADGFAPEANTFGDVIFSDKAMMPAGGAACPTQYFWEAFPASSSPTQRTTYLFTYMGLDPERPSVMEIIEDYWRLLPDYQGVELDELTLQRVLFGLFVAYKDSPLPTRWDRIMQVGDASGMQSPLSFGGFGAITRHMGRLSEAVVGALAADALSRAQLGLINPYQANLRAAWLFQASMRPPVRPGEWSDDFISKVLVATFEVMEARGDAVMRPFLQDVLRPDSLALTIGGLMLSSPAVAVEILIRLGPIPLADWFVHYIAMVLGSAAASEPSRGLVETLAGALPPADAFALRRRLQGWQYGAGMDYMPVEPTRVEPQALAQAKAAAEAARTFASKRAAGVPLGDAVVRSASV